MSAISDPGLSANEGAKTQRGKDFQDHSEKTSKG